MDPVLPYCRKCGGVLVPVMAIYDRGRPHRATGHQLSYEHAGVSECRECGAGQLEKVWHDCFHFDEAWDHCLWLVLEPDDARSMRQLVRSCPRPTWPRCACEVHRALVESLRMLSCEEWIGPVLPEYAEEHRLAANTKGGVLATTADGFPVLIERAS